MDKRASRIPSTKQDILQAVQRIKKGELVAFPTETVYGLGANALDARAVHNIFIAKGRPKDNPFIVHVSDEKMLRSVVKTIPPLAKKVMKKFWPGPLTILFEKNKKLSPVVTAGLSTVAVRMPAHPLALELIHKSGVPIAAPSANKSGRPSPTTVEHVHEDFGKKIFVLDGGKTKHGVESTVVSLSGKPKVLRLGAISYEELKKIIPGLVVDVKLKKGVASSPGQKYKHYAPAQPMILFSSLKKLVSYAQLHKDSVILCKEKNIPLISRTISKSRIISLGKTDEDVARNIYDRLRTKKGKLILVLGVQKKGIGRTVMDRLERAATKIV